MKAFLFPGQGSQFVGMGRELFYAFPEAREIFEEVDEALSQKLSKIIFDGPESDLTLTKNTQPALMAVSMAVIKVLEKQSGKKVDQLVNYVAGHSLGEYSALCAAGALSVSDTARLLKIRGQAMQKAVAPGEGAMAAILGLDLKIVEEIAQEASALGVCQVANDNSDGQVVVSGSKAAVDKAAELATEKGAKRSVLLNVSAPFHCDLMKSAADRMNEALSEVKILTPTVPVMANLTAEINTDASKIRELLVGQVTGRVRWRESMIKLADLGVTQGTEVGAGKVLSGLLRRIDDRIGGSSICTPQEIENYLNYGEKKDVSVA